MSDISTKPLLVSIVGPTAVGKTALAIRIARKFNTQIISADSRQLYRELNIGTAKPSSDELLSVKHYFINSHSINDHYSSGEYHRDALKLIEKLHQEINVVVAVGGSSLYLKALWEGFDEMPEVDLSIREALNSEFESKGLGFLLNQLKSYDPDYYKEVDRRNHQRVIRALEVIRSSGLPFSYFRKSSKLNLSYQNLKIGLSMDREQLFRRINERMDLMIEQGLFQEAQDLLPFKDHNALQTVGYSEIFDFMEGKYDMEEAIRLLKRNSRRYAKRQMTWFRKYEDIYWFESHQIDQILQLIESKLS